MIIENESLLLFKGVLFGKQKHKKYFTEFGIVKRGDSILN